MDHFAAPPVSSGGSTLFLIATLIATAMLGFWEPGAPDLSIRNEYIEVGVSKQYGGAITYVSVRGQARNLVNNNDKGRQVQQSIYAGPMVDRAAEGQRKNWSPWPWNPVQAGDAYDNKSRIIEMRADETSIYTKVQPLLWDMNNELAEAYYETWITLDGPAAHVHNQVTCFRTDNRWGLELKEQELPAAYFIGALHTLYTYQGEHPWTHAPLDQLPHVFPSQRLYATEKWAAYVDANNQGVGVYNPDVDYLLQMFHGESAGETGDPATGYIAPVKQMTLERDSTFTYDYYLIVGSPQDVRAFVYEKEGKASPGTFRPTPPPLDAERARQRRFLAISAGVVAGLLGVTAHLTRRHRAA